MELGTANVVLVYQSIIGWHLVHQTGLSNADVIGEPITARCELPTRVFCTKSTHSVRNEIRCHLVQHCWEELDQ